MSTSLLYTLILIAIILAAVARAVLSRKSLLTGFFDFLGRLEVAIISVLLAALVFFGCIQIVLRNFLHSGIVWADPLMRHIVLWLGCLGGVMATARVRHINIDILTRALPKGIRPLRDRIIHFATAATCATIGIAALKLVADEKEFGTTAFLGVQSWVLQLILPIAFFLVAYRSLTNMLLLPEGKPIDWDVPGNLDDKKGTE